MKKRYGHKRFYKLLEELADLHSRKAEAYEGNQPPYVNHKKIQPWVPAIVEHQKNAAFIYALIRTEEKLERVRNLLEGANPGDEAVEETLMDISVLALISLILYEERDG